MLNATPAMAAWFGFPLELPDRLRLIKQAGFEAVLLWWDDNMQFELPVPQKCEAAHKAGLAVANAHLPFSNMNSMWLDGIEGDLYRDYLCRLVTQAGKYGVPTLVLHLTRTKTPPPESELGYSRFMQIVDAAEKANVSIAFENLKAYERLYKFMSRADSKRVGICFDSGHNNCHCKDRRVAVDFANSILAVHLHDNDGTRDSHLLPFDGTTDWKQVKRELIASSYAGVWSLEVEFDSNGIFGEKRTHSLEAEYRKLSAEEYLEMAMERVKRLMALSI